MPISRIVIAALLCGSYSAAAPFALGTTWIGGGQIQGGYDYGRLGPAALVLVSNTFTIRVTGAFHVPYFSACPPPAATCDSSYAQSGVATAHFDDYFTWQLVGIPPGVPRFYDTALTFQLNFAGPSVGVSRQDGGYFQAGGSNLWFHVTGLLSWTTPDGTNVSVPIESIAGGRAIWGLQPAGVPAQPRQLSTLDLTFQTPEPDAMAMFAIAVAVWLAVRHARTVRR